jgi:hypothetical protein
MCALERRAIAGAIAFATFVVAHFAYAERTAFRI